jgi:hypothetical protein
MTYTLKTRVETENQTNVDKIKIDWIRSQRILGIQPINEWVERRAKEGDKHVKRMNAERLIKISRDNLPVIGRSGHTKGRWGDLIPG